MRIVPTVKTYLGSPGNQLQADAARGMPVLVSFASWQKFKPLTQWMPSFDEVLVDSGAYSEMNSGVVVDLDEYLGWVEAIPWATNWAGLDDINGNWKRSLKNYERGGFPTIHDTDPPELLDDLIPIARAAGNWIGIGLSPPRQGKERFVRDTIERIPDDLHIHGWALGMYTHLALDSIDSTHWWREAMKYRDALPWLTYGEALEISVKKAQRLDRIQEPDHSLPLFTPPKPRGKKRGK
jgi:hypothetical protein